MAISNPFLLAVRGIALFCLLAFAEVARATEDPEDSQGDWKAELRRYLEASTEEERAPLLEGLEAIPVDDLREELIRLDAEPREPFTPGRHDIDVAIAGTDLTSRYVLVIPEDYDPAQEWPLWIAMHGTSGSGNDCAQFLRKETAKHRFVLACPTAHESHRSRGWGFTPEERALTLSVLADVKRRVRVDPDRVILSGWSRGGHATFDVAVHHPGLFAGVQPVTGAPRAHYFGMLRNLGDPSVYILNGANDDERLLIAVRNGVEYLTKKIRADVTYVEDPERGHDLLLEHLPAAADAMMAARRDASPDRIVVAAHADARTEGAWLRIDAVNGEVHRPGAGLRIPGYRASASEESKLSAAHKAVFDATGWVEAKRGRNAFSLKADGVLKVTLLLDADAIDWKRNVRVTLGGKRLFSDKVQPSARTLLEGYHARRDIGRLFLAELPIELTK